MSQSLSYNGLTSNVEPNNHIQLIIKLHNWLRRRRSPLCAVSANASETSYVSSALGRWVNSELQVKY